MRAKSNGNDPFSLLQGIYSIRIARFEVNTIYDVAYMLYFVFSMYICFKFKCTNNTHTPLYGLVISKTGYN